MDRNKISGQRQYEFVERFNYIREAGTLEERRAAEEILEDVKKLGLTGRLEEFEFTAYEIAEECLVVTEPYEKEYRVTGYKRCGDTPKDGVEAPFLYIENGDEISLSFAKGKIVMVNGPVKKEMYQNLVRAQAAGFVTMSGIPIDAGEDLEPAGYTLRGVEKTPIQGVNLHYKDAVELVERGASRVKLTLRQKKVTRVSRNIAARIEGSDKAEEMLTLSAHYDSVPQGPGAYDNMAGAAIIMELARYFTENRPRRTMEFIWFGAEETGLCGSLAYVKEHEAELSGHRFNMNVDLAGQLIGGTVIGVAADAAVCQMLAFVVHEAGMGVSFINGIWGSDSNTFAWKGIPAMTLNRDGFGMHTRYDTIDLISPWSLKRSAFVLGCIAEGLAQAEVMPFKREVPEEFKKKLDTYFAEA
ncbi:M28 family metallopeptidase [Anaerocolumna xylanovorans]|uniref:Carboxypeptidase Q n=1 Tax=Anaerocolumna xylanovorans DSM 12503 TaxID=1121345 RepID=A0A1M7Y9F0_9FIRM|nr:M28 family metallopeptidase [Anaerocolumna xylanovorans]SHO49229.1 Zn-dependent amino-or carboxypeptidase, M28 family [Anaerocolumna xylanovorans DSM 12503]